MKVLVDTSVWSIALRRSGTVRNSRIIKEHFQSLIEDGRVAIIGPIRQEILSGIKLESQFESLRERLEAFRDLSLATEDYILAAKFFNTCRAKGVQGSHIDFLICATASRNDLPLFTTDKDFSLYARHLDFPLYKL
jgi:predicted nucleic acid-binding protein